jgi:hypothetical protein
LDAKPENMFHENEKNPPDGGFEMQHFKWQETAD